mgnify:CR=1 FL=1|jgi:hypothetical protein
MTPEARARQIYTTYEQLIKDFTRGVTTKELAKECALAAVKEIYAYTKALLSAAHGVKNNADYVYHNSYLDKVKQEIEKI